MEACSAELTQFSPTARWTVCSRRRGPTRLSERAAPNGPFEIAAQSTDHGTPSSPTCEWRKRSLHESGLAGSVAPGPASGATVVPCTRRARARAGPTSFASRWPCSRSDLRSGCSRRFSNRLYRRFLMSNHIDHSACGGVGGSAQAPDRRTGPTVASSDAEAILS